MSGGTWQLSVAVVLAVTLIGGAVWYERSRPTSQVLALVAALAALSVAGRIVFSPVPNVVPSSDISLIAGYTLGGAPGFAVGSLTGLVSNFWLGQGPWTPWQMAGWGMCGLLGAGLARLGTRDIGRVHLAIWCAVAGFAYGALLDLHMLVSYGGDQTLERYLALSARGIPFNVAHAVGNFFFALAAGPAMIRIVRRYRERTEFSWAPRATTTTAAGIAIAVVLAASAAAPQSADGGGGGPQGATQWLRSIQNKDGGFGFGPGVESSPAMTGWASLGLESAGVNPLDVRKRGKTPIDYLRSTVGEITTTGDVERTILVVESAGLNSRSFAGKDLVARLLTRRGGNGSYGGQVNPTAFGVLALEAAGATRGSAASAAWLARAQNEDGGWGFAPGSPSEPDSTGAVLQALAAAGSGSNAIRRGVSYLRSVQQPGGGFPIQGGSSSNSQSTAWAVQGLVAAGTSPRSFRAGGRNPLDYLAARQASDGHYRYSNTTDQTPVWVTSQAMQAVAGEPFPLSQVSSTTGGKASGSGISGGSGGALPPAAPAPGRGGGIGPGPGAGPAPQDPGKDVPLPAPPGDEMVVPESPDLDRIEDLPDEEEAASAGDGDGFDFATAGSVVLLVAVAAGGYFLLRRQGRRLG